MEQGDIERLLEKRWKRYRAGQKRRKLRASMMLAAIRAAGAVAGMMRKARLLKQIRRERVAVE